MTPTSALVRLLKSVTPLAPAMSIADVADRLLTPEHKTCLSLPIVDAAGYPLGLVSRSALQDICMQRFGRDLGLLSGRAGLRRSAPGHGSGPRGQRT